MMKRISVEKWRRRLQHAALLGLAVVSPLAASALTEEQRQVPLEQDSPDPKLAKVVLLAGSVSNRPGQHEYFAGCALMMKWLKAEQGVWPVMAAEGWPQNEKIFEGARSVVVFMDGGAKLSFLAPERWALIERLMAKGTGLVMLHQAVDVPAAQVEQVKGWLGGAFLGDIGCRGHWDMDFSKFPQHAITSGVGAFSAPLDGWLYNLHFAPGALPLVQGTVPDKSRTSADAKTHAGREETIGWASQRAGGGRSFGFTGCDLHRNWGVEGQRRLVVNGILWTAGLEVPAAGAKVELAADDLQRNLDDKPAPAPKKKATKAPAL
jgi:hypothetical protein